jgi:hypothetical protein
MHARVISTLRALELPEADAAVLEYVHRCVNEAVERQPKMPHAPADPTPERTAAWKAGVVMGALVAALIVLLGVLAYVARTYDPPPSVGQPLDMAGDVQAKDYGARNYHPLHEGARLYAGLSLRTDRGARFAAEADTAVLYVDETTELAFGPPGAYALAIGRIHAEHTSEKGPPVEIMTAPARVFVKNGQTVLRSDGERITAFCLSGTATLARSGQEDVVLEPGQAGAVGREGISTTVRPFAKPYQTHWLRRFASMPGGPRSYDELMCLAANQLWPPVTDGDGEGIEALEIDLRLDGPLAALDVTSSDGARPGPGQAFLSGPLGGGWTMQRNGARGRLFAALLRQQETFRLGIAPDALTNRPIRRVALHLPGIEPAFSGTQWQREGDTWSATHVDPHRGIVLELPAKAVAERGTLAKGTGGEGHGDVTGRLLPYDPQGDLWLERGSRIVVVFDRAGFAGERQFTRACLFVDRFLRHMTPHVSCMVIDAVEVPAGPAPATGPRIDRIMARLWDAPTEDHAEPGFADIMRLALAASSDLEQPLVLAVTGSAFDLPEQGSRLVGERPLIVCRVPPPAADRGADGTADPGTRPYRGFWNERRVLWTLPPELPVELGVRILLTSMRSPGVPQSALPEGHRMLQADFTAQPVVTAREGHSTR